MKIEHYILIALALGAAVFSIFSDEIVNGPVRMALLEHRVDVLEQDFKSRPQSPALQ